MPHTNFGSYSHVSIETVTAYDPLAVDAYAEHLSEINTSQPVTVSKDIFNQHGILLIKKGQSLSKEKVERIVQLKLLRPLESSIEIENSLTPKRLLEAIEESQKFGRGKIADTPEFQAEIASCCRALFQYPLLGQKLTVLSTQMPEEFKKAVTVAWTSLIVALQMRMPREDRASLFIAAMTHDIGMLHIPRDIVVKKAALTAEEWRAIKSHTIIGQKILEQVKGLSPAIPVAVFEHHEMSDGTGYPKGGFGHELGSHGQIIGILDSVFAIFFHKLAPKKLGTRFLIPILQMNASCYRQDVYNAVYNQLRVHPHDAATLIPPHGEAEIFLEELMNDASSLRDYHIKVAAITDVMISGAIAQKRMVRAVHTLNEQLQILLRRSGVLEKSYFFDLAAASRAPSADITTEVEAAYLMLQELRWQMLKLTRLCFAIADDDSILSQEQRKMVTEALSSLPNINVR